MRTDAREKTNDQWWRRKSISDSSPLPVSLFVVVDVRREKQRKTCEKKTGFMVSQLDSFVRSCSARKEGEMRWINEFIPFPIDFSMVF